MKKGVIPILTPDPASAPAVNTAATWTLAADAKNGWAIKQIIFGYDSAPTGGFLSITWGTNTISVPVTSGGAGPLILEPPRVFPLNTAVVITLAAAGASVTGKIMDVGAWKTMEVVGA